MAEVVLGLASSHTPQLSTSAAYWGEHAARDGRNPALLGPDGRYRTYDELLAEADPALAGELETAVWEAKFERAQVAVEALAQRLARVTVGGAMADLRFDLVDYIPAYRSPAGTGVGMAFATWDPASSP